MLHHTHKGRTPRITLPCPTLNSSAGAAFPLTKRLDSEEYSKNFNEEVDPLFLSDSCITFFYVLIEYVSV